MKEQATIPVPEVAAPEPARDKAPPEAAATGSAALSPATPAFPESPPENDPAQTARHLEVGRRGEAIARRFLWKRGFRILARNVSGRHGEIDLIAEKSGRVRFVEVKTRTSESLGRPEERVDSRKHARLRKTAQSYLDGFRDPPPMGFQFDVISILLDKRGRPVRQEWIEDAF